MKILQGNGKEMPLREWQAGRGLKKDTLSGNFKVTEFECESELILSEILIDYVQAIRYQWGKSIKINSGYRSEAKQKALKAQGYKTATNSPHVVGMAADLDTTSKAETEALVALIRKLATSGKWPIRLGYKQYLNQGQTFVHLDVCPAYYAKGQPLHETKHPQAWEISGLTW